MKIIITIRNQEVMLDKDFADLFKIETKNLNKSLKRHLEKFNDINRFQLTNDEFEALRFQNGTSNLGAGGRRYLPFVFTKEGVEIALKIMKKDINIVTLFPETKPPQLLVQNEDLRSKTYNIRGLQVMLDFDLAQLYKVEAKTLNQAVKRNLNRFPNHFRFQLIKSEFDELVTNSDHLRSQFATSSLEHGGRRYLPFVFTE